MEKLLNGSYDHVELSQNKQTLLHEWGNNSPNISPDDIY